MEILCKRDHLFVPDFLRALKETGQQHVVRMLGYEDQQHVVRKLGDEGLHTFVVLLILYFSPK